MVLVASPVLQPLLEFRPGVVAQRKLRLSKYLREAEFGANTLRDEQGNTDCLNARVNFVKI